MNLRVLYALHCTPFPAGGRIAAHVDLRESGIEPAYTQTVGEAFADRRDMTRQPTNRGLDLIVGVAHLSGVVA